MRSLTRTNEKNFSKKIEDWHKKYKQFLGLMKNLGV